MWYQNTTQSRRNEEAERDATLSEAGRQLIKELTITDTLEK